MLVRTRDLLLKREQAIVTVSLFATRPCSAWDVSSPLC